MRLLELADDLDFLLLHTSAPDFFNCFMKLSVTLPPYCVTKVEFGSWFSSDLRFLAASSSLSFRMILSIIGLIIPS